jgi:hypothetical protein
MERAGQPSQKLKKSGNSLRRSLRRTNFDKVVLHSCRPQLTGDSTPLTACERTTSPELPMELLSVQFRWSYMLRWSSYRWIPERICTRQSASGLTSTTL